MLSIVRDSAPREVTGMVVRDGANVARAIVERWVRGPDNVLRLVWSAQSAANLAATADPMSVAGARSSRGTVPVSTNTTLVTPTGGKAPYTYSWNSVAGWSVSAPTSAGTYFSANVPAGQDKEAEFTCTVTDASGNTTTAIVNALVSNYGGDGGNIQ